MLRLAVLLLLFMSLPCDTLYGQVIRRGSAAAAAKFKAATMQELAAMSHWTGCALYRTDTEMNKRNYRKASQLAKTVARTILKRPQLQEEAMISTDRRRFAYSDRQSDILVAINIRERRKGELTVNTVELKLPTIQPDEVKEWLQVVAQHASDDAEDQARLVELAHKNYMRNKATEERVLVRDKSFRHDLAAWIKLDGVYVATSEIFGGRPDGEGTPPVIGNHNPD